MAFAQRTLSMSATSGYVVPLDETKGQSSVKMTAHVACWVQTIPFGSPPPSAPTTSPAPAAGSITPWYHFAPGEQQTFGAELWKGGDPSIADSIGYVVVYCEATAGELCVNAH